MAGNYAICEKCGIKRNVDTRAECICQDKEFIDPILGNLKTKYKRERNYYGESHCNDCGKVILSGNICKGCRTIRIKRGVEKGRQDSV